MSSPHGRRRPQHEEHQHGVALMAWVQLVLPTYPELALLYHIPNGAVLGGKTINVGGREVSLEAIRLRDSGVKAGVPDYHLPVGRGGYLSLYVELKRVNRGGGRTSKAQRDLIPRLRDEGNRVEVCQGWTAARAVILDYLNSGPTRIAHEAEHGAPHVAS